MILRGLHGAVEVAADVHVHGLLERAQAHVDHRARNRVGGGVVDQHVEAEAAVLDLAEQAVEALDLAHVRGDRAGDAALGADRLDHALAGLELAAAHDHVRAEARELMRGGRADATAGAGDEAGLAGQVEQLVGHGALPRAARRAWRRRPCHNPEPSKRGDPMAQARALITGAGSGLGRALALRYAQAGLRRGLRRHPARTRAGRRAELGGAPHLALEVDVGDDASFAELHRRSRRSGTRSTS
jgi:hypothetical protein